MDDAVCECGDLESQHIDGSEQCTVVDCGCREFTEADEEAEEEE